MVVAAKNATNPHFGKTYADYESIRKLVDPGLKAAGIVVLQPVRIERPEPRIGAQTVSDGATTSEYLHDDPQVVVTTRLWHAESGQWLEEDLAMPVDRMNAQGVGSARTYAMRYALASLLAIATGEDDDGNAAVGDSPKPAKKPPKPKTETKKPANGGAKASEAQCKMIKSLMAQLKYSNPEKVAALLEAMHYTDIQKKKGLEQYGVDTLELISPEQTDKIRESVFGKLPKPNASNLIEALKAKVDGAKPPAEEKPAEDRAAAMEILNNTIANTGCDEPTLKSLLVAFFKVESTGKLDAAKLIKLAERVEEHMKAQGE
jgi:hypothetical protein